MKEYHERAGLVEVINTQDPGSAYIAHTVLEQEGLFVRIENEHTNAIPGFSIGISIMVKKEDVDRAIKILEQADLIPDQNKADDTLLSDLNLSQQKQRKRIWSVLLILVILIALFALWTIILNPG